MHNIAIHTILLVTALLILLPGPAVAENETYAITLGNRQLGSLVFEGDESNASLLSTLDNTPLGVANGTFEAAARAKDGNVACLTSAPLGQI